MYSAIIRNDMIRNKRITLTTLFFVTLAAMLVSLSAILIVNLTGSINTLMIQAKTPHFMQMHSGEIDIKRLTAFAERNDKVEQFQVLDFLNIEGGHIVIDGHSLSGSVQDHGLVTQSKKFDFLLDLNGNVITVSDGEIYVPVNYMKDGTAKVGDNIAIAGHYFTVAGFLRDSQMNSLLASSKRFLVSEHDYKNMRYAGSEEYLIEFRLHQLSMLPAFEQDYITSGIEANGPTVTYPLFKMINAISDGMMIAVILLASVLVVVITFMCIRYTLLATMESEYREIGVLKAIGLRLSDIRKIYLAKYLALTMLGCMLGLALSIIYKGVLLENIRLFMGESEHSSAANYAGLLGVCIVFISTMLFANTVMRRCRNISAAEAIRYGTSQEKSNSSSSNIRLSQTKWININVLLGIKDVLVRKRLFGTMLVVILISTFVMIVPQNLYNTISSKSFITYMGIGHSDLRFDIQQTNDMKSKVAAIEHIIEHDVEITQYTTLTTSTYHVMMEDGSQERIKVELGDHSVFPVTYSEGRGPITDDELALSVLNADELGVTTGDGITLLVDGHPKKLTITGIYSDVTNGGKTAKAHFKADLEEIMWSVIYAKLKDPALIEQKTMQYADQFRYAKVTDINEFVTQTFGPTIDSVGKASLIAIIVMLSINVLVTLLFLKLLIEKDKYSNAVLKSIGFTNGDIIIQYFTRTTTVLLIGIICGVIAAQTIGPIISGEIISMLGVSSFSFVINPLSAYVICPFLVIGTVLVATSIGIWNVGKMTLSEHIKE